MGDTISVLVVDDHPVFADALGARLAAERGIDPVYRAYTSAEALRRLRHTRVDVAVVDYLLDDDTGSALARRVRDESPDTAVIMLSGVDSVDAVVDALAAGAKGWLPKTVEIAHLVKVVRRARLGEMWLDPAMLARVVPVLLDRGSQVDPLVGLTGREREVLEAVGEALSRREIADRLGISENTVRTHLQNVLAKLGVHSSVEAVALLLRSQQPFAQPPYPQQPNGQQPNGQQPRPQQRFSRQP